MSDIMTIDSASSGRLSFMGALRFSGADAVSFLQGQVSNDTQRLTEHTPVLAAYSTAQGRVLALIYLLPHSSGVVAILPREILVPTMERMRKFILRAKVRIEDAADLVVAGQLGGKNPRPRPAPRNSPARRSPAGGRNLARGLKGSLSLRRTRRHRHGAGRSR